MIRHLQHKYIPKLLEWELNAAEFTNPFDYLCILTGSRKSQNRGFAFVNFATATIAERIRRMFDGATFVLYPSNRPMDISPADM